MKNFKISIAAGLLLLGGSVAAQTAAVPTIKQTQTNWCWATDSQCILEYYGTKKTQCEIVEYARTLQPSTFGSSNCCGGSVPSKCNNPNEIKYNYGITGMIDHFGSIKGTAQDGPISASKVTSELTAKRPFVIGISWSSGGGHVVVGCGFNSSTNSMTIMDSWTGSKTTSKYNSNGSISTGSGSGTWIETLVITTPFTTTGIADAGVAAKDVTVYPNPSEGNINITSVDNMKTINVYNMAGQLVDSYAVAGDKTFALQIPVAGFYNVQVITDNGGAAYKKIVVSNN